MILRSRWRGRRGGRRNGRQDEGGEEGEEGEEGEGKVSDDVQVDWFKGKKEVRVKTVRHIKGSPHILPKYNGIMLPDPNQGNSSDSGNSGNSGKVGPIYLNTSISPRTSPSVHKVGSQDCVGRTEVAGTGCTANASCDDSHTRFLKENEELWPSDELFMKIDLDKNGMIEFDELSVLHGFDKEASPYPIVLTP